MINKILFKKKLINLFFKLLPRQCIVCESESESNLCLYCLQSLPFIKPYCEKCGLLLNHRNKNNEVNSNNIMSACTFCQNNIAEFNKFITVFDYQEPVKSLIKDFKYYNNYLYKKTLGNILLDKLLSKYFHDSMPEVIIPIPSHQEKLRSRGYNQSVELANFLSKKLNIPLDANYITKVKHTSSQVGLNREERIQNLKGSFQINYTKYYKHVAIVDDVVTTGATVNNVKKIIKNDISDAIIDVWCLAKQQI